MKKLLATLCVAVIIVGCNPGVIIKQNPGPHNHGLRFYRPKPYLFVAPVDKENVADTNALEAMKSGLVKLKLEYLPDFNEEYSVRTRVGLGKAKTQVTLRDGWNLTQLDTELDSKFAENVSAIADLLKAVSPGGLLPTPKAAPSAAPELAPAVVPASNVPLGYYESVIARGPDGKKRLYGWKYVGFMPFAGCPIEAGGYENWCCQDGRSPIYGLVNVKGVMTFMQLPDIALLSGGDEVVIQHAQSPSNVGAGFMGGPNFPQGAAQPQTFAADESAPQPPTVLNAPATPAPTLPHAATRNR